MSPELAVELEKTRDLFASVGRPFPQVSGATAGHIGALEVETSVHVGKDLAALWRLMNGSSLEKVFAVRSDWGVTPVNFLSTPRAARFWRYSVEQSEEQRSLHKQEPPRDSRIRHAAWIHPCWLPFAEYNEGTTLVYYDADPGPGGSVGQIIAYQHDPDGIHYIARNLAEFARASNNLLAADAHELIVEYGGV